MNKHQKRNSLLVIVSLVTAVLYMIFAKPFAGPETAKDFIEKYPLESEIDCFSFVSTTINEFSVIDLKPAEKGTFLISGLDMGQNKVLLINSEGNQIDEYVLPEGMLIYQGSADLPTDRVHLLDVETRDIKEIQVFNNQIKLFSGLYDYEPVYSKEKMSENVDYQNVKKVLKSWPDGGGMTLKLKNLSVDGINCASDRYYIRDSVKISETQTAVLFDTTNTFYQRQSAILAVLGE